MVANAGDPASWPANCLPFAGSPVSHFVAIKRNIKPIPMFAYSRLPPRRDMHNVHKVHKVHKCIIATSRCKPVVSNDLSLLAGQKTSAPKIWCICIIALFALLAGCGQHDQIAHYTVTKPELIDPTLATQARSVSEGSKSATESQTIGLIVPVGDTGWFFKLTGDKAAVEPQHEAFLQFVTSIKFTGPDAKPNWTLPPDWKQLPGSAMRYATIQIAAEGKPLELSVIPLPQSGGDTEKYVLDNVNRWRNQLNLKPINADELPTTTKSLKIGGHDATLVSFVGTGSGGMSGGAPFAPFAGGSLPPDHPPIGKATSTTSDKPKP